MSLNVQCTYLHTSSHLNGLKFEGLSQETQTKYERTRPEGRPGMPRHENCPNEAQGRMGSIALPLSKAVLNESLVSACKSVFSTFLGQKKLYT